MTSSCAIASVGRCSIVSHDHLVSPYNAFYLALSQRDGASLISRDERLVNGTQGKGFDVRHVSGV